MNRSRLALCLWAGLALAGNAEADVLRREPGNDTPTVPATPAGATSPEGMSGAEHAPDRQMDPAARPADVKREDFGSDPVYADKPYDTAAQLAIYGGKTRVDGPRPPIAVLRRKISIDPDTHGRLPGNAPTFPRD